MFDLEAMSENLLDARDRLGVTQKEVASETGIHQNTLFFLENAKKSPRADTMVILANYYGATVQELFFADQGKENV
ncbi:helix-turn-helix transcriptional regulator [Salicibibacter kimchii]|uniref:helix-turn-helix transcriptional regulator n=1 Tax=Salicibibacter kimchii TaxID=2099786 RepID=UPI001356C9C6|nr:helix-turn-helix transcriptional regulator [Salicibibacter kimchii]